MNPSFAIAVFTDSDGRVGAVRKIITRRSFLRSMFAAPAIVAASNIMPVRAIAALCGGGPWQTVEYGEGYFLTETTSSIVDLAAGPDLTVWALVRMLDDLRHEVHRVFLVPPDQISPYPRAIADSRKPRLNART